jgi:tetratricopeptide (TPR) repeat protein
MVLRDYWRALLFDIRSLSSLSEEGAAAKGPRSNILWPFKSAGLTNRSNNGQRRSGLIWIQRLTSRVPFAEFGGVRFMTPPFDSQPLQDEAKTHMRRHDWVSAIPLLEADIVEHPSDPWSQIFLGSCHMELKNFDVALLHFRAAEALAPNESTPVGCQGDVYCAAGDWTAAGGFYRRALEMNPDDELAMKNWRWWNTQITGG